MSVLRENRYSDSCVKKQFVVTYCSNAEKIIRIILVDMTLIMVNNDKRMGIPL